MMDLKEIVKAALEEDIGTGDITTQLIVDPNRYGHAKVIARARGVVSGLPPFREVFRQIDPKVLVDVFYWDGISVVKNDVIVELTGRYASILQAERTALNFLGRLSGIATYTRLFVSRVTGTKTVILDTRKTTPLLRSLEKQAVIHGGGQNHRFGLYDMVLIKENHIAAAGGVKEAVTAVTEGFKKTQQKLPVIVEVQNLAQIRKILKQPIDRIMLDNFDLDMIKKAVELVRGRVPLEVSGGVDLLNVREIAGTGVDYISIGALTHSAPSLNFTLLLE